MRADFAKDLKEKVDKHEHAKGAHKKAIAHHEAAKKDSAEKKKVR